MKSIYLVRICVLALVGVLSYSIDWAKSDPTADLAGLQGWLQGRCSARDLLPDTQLIYRPGCSERPGEVGDRHSSVDQIAGDLVDQTSAAIAPGRTHRYRTLPMGRQGRANWCRR